MIDAKTIAVHGATGSQGAPVASLLTAAGHRVRPLTRATGADLYDRASLEAAYAESTPSCSSSHWSTTSARHSSARTPRGRRSPRACATS